MNDPVIFFDGVCNLCNSAVDFIIKRDSKGTFKFSSLQSPEAQKLLKSVNLDQEELTTMILLKQGQVYTRSDAALEIARNLDGVWPLLYGLKVVPKFIRNGVYQWISRNRYRWFGKRDTCRIPTDQEKQRFLSNISSSNSFVAR